MTSRGTASLFLTALLLFVGCGARVKGDDVTTPLSFLVPSMQVKMPHAYGRIFFVGDYVGGNGDDIAVEGDDEALLTFFTLQDLIKGDAGFTLSWDSNTNRPAILDVIPFEDQGETHLIVLRQRYDMVLLNDDENQGESQKYDDSMAYTGIDILERPDQPSVPLAVLPQVFHPQTGIFHNTLGYFGDLDGDGNIDVVLPVFRDQNGFGAAAIELGPNLPNRLEEFSKLIQAPPSSGAGVATQIDGMSSGCEFDGDGLDDVFMWSAGSAWIYRSKLIDTVWDAELVITIQNLYTRAFPSRGPQCLGDLDGDGKDDLLVFLAREAEDAKPKPAVIFGPLTSEPVMVSDLGLDIIGANPMGDLDGDGLADLAIDGTKDGHGRVVVLAGRADRTLAPLYQIELGPVKSDESVQLGAGDLDADGTRDLVLLHLKNRDNRLLIFLQPFTAEETPNDHAP